MDGNDQDRLVLESPGDCDKASKTSRTFTKMSLFVFLLFMTVVAVGSCVVVVVVEPISC